MGLRGIRFIVFRVHGSRFIVFMVYGFRFQILRFRLQGLRLVA